MTQSCKRKDTAMHKNKEGTMKGLPTYILA